MILVNRADPDSERIAEHYAKSRGVPFANIVGLAMPQDETIEWPQFVSVIWEPLMARLVENHWIDAIRMNLADSVGRTKYAVNHHRIAALVICRGVPLRIANDPALYADALPLTVHPEFRTNAASVDGELALLCTPNHPINAFVLNPLFQKDHPSDLEEQQVVKVSRLDGPTVEDAMQLVDRAMAAERDGLLGRAYVDLSGRDPVGDGWLEKTAAELTDLGFAPAIDRDSATMPETARSDAPVLYFGWYTANLDGPFALPGFRFPAGAIALHIHSYSAATLRSTTSGWTGPLIARGVTATVGNVYEPYLELTHRPDLMLRSLARGADLVDAAYYSLQAVSWENILIGDPLYRPFVVPVERQLDQIARLPPELAGYAVLRRAQQLDLSGHAADAAALLQHEMRERPSMPVALAVAERAGERNGLHAKAALEAVPLPTQVTTDEWAMIREVANRLSAFGDNSRAVMFWDALLDDPALPRNLRADWIGDALRAARATGDELLVEKWHQRADGLGRPADGKSD